MDMLNLLNPQQRDAATHKEGPLLILAGAGSGKTRVITYRVAYLIKEGIEPKNILAVTFTNKAAEEMRKRIDGLCGSFINGSGPLISTFHSACVRILREGGGKSGGVFSKNFIIYDKADALTVTKNCVKELNINEELYPSDSIARKISSLKNNLISPDRFNAQAFGFEDKVKKVYQLYQNKLMADNALDFDDLLMKTAELFESNKEILSHYQDRFKYIMVDEYQDTNYAQYRLMMLLSDRHRNVCVVGDDDQGIYSFRGANIGNILNFERDFPDAKVIKLEQNYRSTQRILDAASAVVNKNSMRRDKGLWTENPSGEKIRLYEAGNGEEEAGYIIKTIKQLKEKDSRAYKDFAVLYRINAQSRLLEEGFYKNGLPYVVVGGLRFYERKEIKDIISYLRAIVNPNDDTSLRRIINVPHRGIGQITIEKLTDLCKRKGVSLYEGMKSGDEGLRGDIKGFVDLIDVLRNEKDTGLTDRVKEILTKTNYINWLREADKENAETRIENIDEFITAVSDFEERENNPPSPPFSKGGMGGFSDGTRGIESFLDHIALSTQIDEVGDKSDTVFLMTLHNAKGLEFPVVFIAGMEEGLFPNFRALDDEKQLEEERRLCYVGITRAKESLYITCARTRFIHGSERNARPSRFLKEIPAELVEAVKSKDKTYMSYYHTKNNETPPFNSPLTSPIPSLPRRGERGGSGGDRGVEGGQGGINKVGMGGVTSFPVGSSVQHPSFGIGKVRASEGTGENKKVVVDFRDAGLKRLLVRYARLERI
ncbi:MAG: UvrD-helicase domain-containing protein [Nitrospirota bacterium]